MLDKLRVIRIYSVRQADEIAEIAIELKKTNTALASLTEEQKLIKDIFIKVTQEKTSQKQGLGINKSRAKRVAVEDRNISRKPAYVLSDKEEDFPEDKEEGGYKSSDLEDLEEGEISNRSKFVNLIDIIRK